jgi:hypothetical protein
LGAFVLPPSRRACEGWLGWFDSSFPSRFFILEEKQPLCPTGGWDPRDREAVTHRVHGRTREDGPGPCRWILGPAIRSSAQTFGLQQNGPLILGTSRFRFFLLFILLENEVPRASP